MRHSGSRRDFIKAALAATLTGGAMHSEAEPANVSLPVPEESGDVADGSTRDPDLSDIEFPRVHKGWQLSRISRPLGGIGTGGLGLGGRGNLQDWQIFNRPDIGNVPEYAFPGIWVKPAGSDPFSAIIERRLFPPYDLYQEGLGFANVPGLPRFAEAKFFGSFRTSRIEFKDPDCPVHAALDAFSPFKLLDADFSGLPCAVLTYEVQNPGPKATEVVIAWSLTNPVGNSDKRTNTPFRANWLAGILMADPSLAVDDPLQGTFVLAALPSADDVIATLPTWRGGSGWRVGPQEFWFHNFAKTGNLGTSFKPWCTLQDNAGRSSKPSRPPRASADWITTKSATGKAGTAHHVSHAGPCDAGHSARTERKNSRRAGAAQRSRTTPPDHSPAVARMARP